MNINVAILLILAALIALGYVISRVKAFLAPPPPPPHSYLEIHYRRPSPFELYGSAPIGSVYLTSDGSEQGTPCIVEWSDPWRPLR